MKLTPEQKLIELAKMDGWIPDEVVPFCFWKSDRSYSIQGEHLPRYLESYDAIIPLIQKQDSNIKVAVQMWMLKNNTGNFDVTPSQLSDALLQEKGFEV